MNPTPQLKTTLTKTWIIINYANLVMLTVILTTAEAHKWHTFIFPLIIILFSLFIWSYIKVYWVSGAWKIMHKRWDTLQIEDRKMISGIYRKAYSYYAVISIALLLVISILNQPLDIIIVTGLLYLAHIVPCSLYVLRSFKEQSD